MENLVIEMKDVVKTYKELVALDHFSLEVRKGEVLGLLGPNGSGKSTTINTLISLLKQDSGTIKIFNQEMKANSYDLKRDIGVVMQDVAVIEELSVYENIDYFCGLYISDKKLRKQYVKEAIDFVELNEFTKFVPSKLSGGLLRRLNIACGIAHKPKLIFFDEPTVAVDPQSRNKILEQIKELNNQGATIVYTSHYMEEIEYLCNRIVIIDHGRMIASGSKEQLKEMISTQEIINIELVDFDENIINILNDLDNVVSVDYNNDLLEIKMAKGNDNLIVVLDIMKKHNLQFTKVYSQVPTLNDVFLEITGKELRD